MTYISLDFLDEKTYVHVPKCLVLLVVQLIASCVAFCCAQKITWIMSDVQ